ncbi:hypothetical protein [Marinobacter shengliensis]|uniref:hypothetical protein n=1 Tax=Marinobacter shengliensis TaxID=1389223 RepID=UPI001108D18A|nr:hypothetical protein [Marinobacter shengliensis]
MSEQRNNEKPITGEDLLGFRKFYMIGEQKASEMIGNITARCWADCEAGRREVPNDVAEKIFKHQKDTQWIKDEIKAKFV